MSSNDFLALLWRRKGTLALVFGICCGVHLSLLYSRSSYFISDAVVQVRERDSRPGSDSLSGAQIFERFSSELLDRLIDAPGFALAAKAALRDAGQSAFTPRWKSSSLRVERQAGSDFHSISYISDAPDEVVPALRASLAALREMAQNYFEQGLSRARQRLDEQIEIQRQQFDQVDRALRQIRDESGLDIVAGLSEQVAAIAESIEALELRCLDLNARCTELRVRAERKRSNAAPLTSSRLRILAALEGTPLHKTLDDVTDRLLAAELRWARAQQQLTESHPEHALARVALAQEKQVYESFFDKDSPFAIQIQEALHSRQLSRSDPIATADDLLTTLETQLQQAEALRESKRQELSTLQSVQRHIEELTQKREDTGNRLASLESTHRQVDLHANLAPEVVQVFRSPSAPYYLGGELPLSLTLVLLFATLCSLAVAYFLEYFDHRIHNPQVLEKCSGIPLLGTLAWERSGGYPLRNPKEARVEELNAILKKLMVNLPRPAVLLVTGCDEGAGKSTVAFQLAQRAGQFGLRTLVIDADLRLPSAAQHFGLEESPGLGDLLRGDPVVTHTPLSGGLKGVQVDPRQLPLELAHQTISLLAPAGPGDRNASSSGGVITGTPLENVWVVTSGSATPDPAVTLSSARFPEFLRSVRRRFDLCIVDSPPLPIASDALLIAPHVDATLLVVRAGKTTTHGLHWVRRQLSDIEVPIIGAVLNGVRKSSHSYYHYSLPAGGEVVEV